MRLISLNQYNEANVAIETNRESANEHKTGGKDRYAYVCVCFIRIQLTAHARRQLACIFSRDTSTEM